MEDQEKKPVTYVINRDDLRIFEHYAEMFRLNAERINELCSSEKDDVVYGFELGQIHSHMRDCFVEMLEHCNSVKSKESK
jgi:hypothetical protein